MRSYSDLPEEITFNILSRVPAKSVGLCRCVSKPWRTMLSQPDFIKAHLILTKINSLEESLAIFCSAEHGLELYSAPLHNAHQLFDKITLFRTKLSFDGYPDSWPRNYGCRFCSCDGLLLLIDSHRNKLVMNPVTREIRQVPHPPIGVPEEYILFGFGYDSVSDDYKMVIISGKVGLLATNQTFVDIYSLKTDFWKRLESTPYDYNGPWSGRGAFVGGCLHWFDKRKIDGKVAIVAFNLADEKFRELPSLELDNLLSGFYELDVVGGCLCLYNNEEIDVVWVLKEYGVPDSWTKFTVNMAPDWGTCFIRGQEQVMIKVDASNYVMWNLKQGTSKEIVFNGFNGKFTVVASFVESLVSPHVRL